MPSPAHSSLQDEQMELCTTVRTVSFWSPPEGLALSYLLSSLLTHIHSPRSTCRQFLSRGDQGGRKGERGREKQGGESAGRKGKKKGGKEREFLKNCCYSLKSSSTCTVYFDHIHFPNLPLMPVTFFLPSPRLAISSLFL